VIVSSFLDNAIAVTGASILDRIQLTDAVGPIHLVAPGGCWATEIRARANGPPACPSGASPSLLPVLRL
jgi:hypothetical protein